MNPRAVLTIRPRRPRGNGTQMSLPHELLDARDHYKRIAAALDVLVAVTISCPAGKLIGPQDDDDGDWYATIATDKARLSVFIERNGITYWHLIRLGQPPELHDGPITIELAVEAMRVLAATETK